MTAMLRHRRRRGRLAVLVTGAVVATAALAGCSGTDGDSGDATITVWAWGQPADGMKAAVPAFETAHPGVKVDVQDVGNPAIWDKITTGMAAGGSGLADVMDIGADYMSNYTETFPQGFADLSELGADDLAADFPTGAWKGGQNADGDQFGIPFEVNMNLLYYRADLFDQIGVDMDQITTWDQLLDAGIELKEQTGADLFALDKAASQADAANVWQLLTRLQGSFFFDEDGNISLNDDAGVTALDFLKRANDAGVVADVPMGQGTTSQTKGQTEVALLPGASWMVHGFTTDAPEMQGKWAVRSLPAMTDGGHTAASAGGTYLTVAGSSPHKKEAWEFVKYSMATMEGQQAVYDAGQLFPSYRPMWDTDAFAQPDEYFGTNVNQLVIASLSEDLPADNYTKDYARALKAFDDAQTRVLTSGADPREALDEAAELLAQQTGRELSTH